MCLPCSEGDGQLEEDEEDEGFEEEDYSNMTEAYLCGPPREF